MRTRPGVGRLFRRPRSPYWWAAFTLRGQEVRRSTEQTDRAAAETWLAEHVAALGTGQVLSPRADRVTVRELLDALQTKYRVEERPSLRTLPSHIAAWDEALGPEKAVAIDEATLLRIVNGWKSRFALATIDKLLATLRRAYRIALKDRRIGTMPSFPHLRFFNTREHFCDWPTVLALVVALGTRDPALADFTEWAARTGMRRGEIRQLTWAGDDAETQVLRLPGRAAKTGHPRRIVLVGPLQALIARRLAARRSDCPYVFHHRNGRPIGDFRKQWGHACTTVGLVAGRDGLTFHDLRRVGVRNLRRAPGVTETVARAITGHLTTYTFTRYNITDDADLAAAMEQVTRYTDQLATAPRRVVPLRRPDGLAR